MRRSIKFRGKRIDTGEWGYGDLIFSNDYPHIGTDKENRFLRECRVDPETVGQYTGLKDKDGKEIYEGDIITGRDALLAGFSQKDNIYGVVDYADGSFVIKGDLLTHYRWLDYNAEVIGNIHDNPELLEKEV